MICNFRFTVTTALNKVRTLSLGSSGVAGEPVTARGVRVSGTRSGTKWKKRRPVRMERSEGVIDAVVNGRVTPVFQEDTCQPRRELLLRPHRKADL